MPRVKGSPKKCVKSNIQQPTNSWVLLLKGEALELPDQYTGTGTPDMVNLRHPNTGESAVFLFSAANNSVQEVLQFGCGNDAEQQRSWFIENTVKSDGKMYLSTPIDPLFLLLPYLRKYAGSHAMPLDQIVRDKDFPETERLLKSTGLKYLSMVADRKGDDSLNAFKYNEEKTLLWLKKKTERVADILMQKNINVGSQDAVSATFIKAKTNENDPSNHAHLHYAHGIVSEYLLADLSQKLLKFLNLPEDTQHTLIGLKRKSLNTSGEDGGLNSNTTKKFRTEEENTSATSNIIDLSKSDLIGNKASSVSSKSSNKDKARAKAASGTKPISSFFKKL